jgi:hypothetical protein
MTLSVTNCVSEELTASIIRNYSDDGGSKLLRSFDPYLLGYTAQHSRTHRPHSFF